MAIKKSKELSLKKQVKKISKNFLSDFDPKHILDQLEKTLKKYKLAPQNDCKKEYEEFELNLNMLLGSKNLENHYLSCYSVSEKYRPFFIEMTNKIIKEYSCVSSIETMLAQNMAIVHIEIMELSKNHMDCLEEKYPTNEKNQHDKLIRKSLDNSRKQLNQLIKTLQDIKNNSLKINIKSQNTMISQNQQINLKNERHFK